jgi:hypothetical protein
MRRANVGGSRTAPTNRRRGRGRRPRRMGGRRGEGDARRGRG